MNKIARQSRDMMDATRQWKRDLHRMVERRDERIADLEDQLAEMELDRDYWCEKAEASEEVAEELIKDRDYWREKAEASEEVAEELLKEVNA